MGQVLFVPPFIYQVQTLVIFSYTLFPKLYEMDCLYFNQDMLNHFVALTLIILFNNTCLSHENKMNNEFQIAEKTWKSKPGNQYQFVFSLSQCSDERISECSLSIDYPTYTSTAYSEYKPETRETKPTALQNVVLEKKTDSEFKLYVKGSSCKLTIKNKGQDSLELFNEDQCVLDQLKLDQLTVASKPTVNGDADIYFDEERRAFLKFNQNFLGEFKLHSNFGYFGEMLQICLGENNKDSLANKEKSFCNDFQTISVFNKISLIVSNLIDLKLLPYPTDQHILNIFDESTKKCLKKNNKCFIDEINIKLRELETKISSFEKKFWKGRENYLIKGDEKKGDRLSFKLAGTHEDSDASRLEITKVSKNKISYQIYVPFYNGHSCEVQGIAEYRKIGRFVDNKGFCVYEIFQTQKGITFNQITPSIDEISSFDYQGCGCSARGNLANIEFPKKNKQTHKRK